jgi:hypothetical protein
MTRKRRLLLASLLAAVAGVFLACGGPVSHEETRKKLDGADASWDHGEKADAVRVYRTVYADALPEEREKILPRIVEFELKAGNTDEAKTWIKRGLDDGVKAKYGNLADDPAAQQLFAAVRKERDEAAAKKAEEARKAEEAARKAKAEEDARPKPTRANYNKIKTGMTVDEVWAILGPGKENARGHGVLIATWQSTPDFPQEPTIITITFSGDGVESKAIVGP